MEVTVFKGATGIGVQSEYQGQARIFPKGSYEEWEKVVEEEGNGADTVRVFMGGICIRNAGRLPERKNQHFQCHRSLCG